MTSENVSFEELSLAIQNSKLSQGNYRSLRNLVKMRLDRAVIEELDDNEVYVGKNEYAMPMDLPITVSTYCTRGSSMTYNGKWYFDERDAEDFVATMEKLGLSVYFDVPSKGFGHKNEIRDPDNWECCGGGDPAQGDGHLRDHGIATKAHLSFMDGKRFTTGVYFCVEEEAVCFVAERDGIARLYYPADSDGVKLLTVGQITFDVGNCYKEIQSGDIDSLDTLAKLMDYDISHVPE